MTTATENMAAMETKAEASSEPALPPLSEAEWALVTDEATRNELALPDFPMRMLRYRNADCRLEVPTGYGVFGDLRQDEQERKYVVIRTNILSPATEPVPSDTTPADLAKMTKAELVASFAEYRARTERTIKALHRHASRRQMCQTFDDIMDHCGWPPRPRRYELVLEVQASRTMSSDDFLSTYLRGGAGRTFDGLGDVITVTEPRRFSYRARLEGRPEVGESAHVHATAEALEQAMHESMAPGWSADAATAVVRGLAAIE